MEPTVNLVWKMLKPLVMILTKWATTYRRWIWAADAARNRWPVGRGTRVPCWMTSPWSVGGLDSAPWLMSWHQNPGLKRTLLLLDWFDVWCKTHWWNLMKSNKGVGVQKVCANLRWRWICHCSLDSSRHLRSQTTEGSLQQCNLLAISKSPLREKV